VARSQGGAASPTSHRRVKRDEAIRWFLPCATAVLCGIEHYDPDDDRQPVPPRGCRQCFHLLVSLRADLMRG
jgi:hypothetical protein